MSKAATAEEQVNNCIDKVRDIGSDEGEAAFDATLTRIAKLAVAHRSDCAVHNAPAVEPGECTCGATAGR